jgi:hypothetical protein
MPFRVIVAGDRRLADYDFVRSKLDAVLALRHDSEVVILSGRAAGADRLGERYAEERGLPCEHFPADWKAHGRAAGPIRNRQMAAAADACMVFDGGGPGSRSMVEEAEAAGLLLRVVDVRNLLP